MAEAATGWLHGAFPNDRYFRGCRQRASPRHGELDPWHAGRIYGPAMNTIALRHAPNFRPTRHLRSRMAARHLSEQAVSAALVYGRLVSIRGAEVYALGRNEVRRYAREGLDLSSFEGVQVVCTRGGTVKTAYRNRDFRGLRPRR